MTLRPNSTEAGLKRLESAVSRARLALAFERVWPRLALVMTVVGLFVALSWLGIWRIGGAWFRPSLLGALALALAWSFFRLARVRMPDRTAAMRRVELLSGLPHRPAHGLSDKISRVADDSNARTLWAANQNRLYASLRNLRSGLPRPEMAERDRNGWRFAVPVLLALGFAVAWGEWATRLGEAFLPIAAVQLPAATRVDAWIDPPPYTRQPPIFLSRRSGEAATTPVSVPEGSTLSIRVVSREPATVTLDQATGALALSPTEESTAAGSEDVIRAYEAMLGGDTTVSIAHADGETAYRIAVIDDKPPTIARGPLTVNRTGSFSLGFNVTDDYGVTEGGVTFRAATPPAADARPLVEAPSLDIRVGRAISAEEGGNARADGRLETHPYAGLEVHADAFVKDAAGQEARPTDSGLMTLPSRPFYNPLARALVEQRQALALDANRRGVVAAALDALTVAPERVADSGVYLGLRVAYHRLLGARNDDELRALLDYLWSMARAIEDGDISDAEARLNAAREALENAIEEGASEEEIARLMDELRQAMRDFLDSYMAEMMERGMQNMPTPLDPNAQMLSQEDIERMLDRIEDLARLGDRDAAQQLLSQLQQMLDNLQMAQPGQMSPMDQEMMRQMDELADIMREQQRLMDDTFQLDQGRRPGDRRQPGEGSGEPLTPEEFARLMEQLQQGQGSLREKLQQLLEGMQGMMGEQGQEGEQGEQGQGGQMGQGGQPFDGDGENGLRSLGRAGRAMGDATNSLGLGESGEAYGYQSDALDALREGMQGLMQQMFANQPGQQGQQAGRGNPWGQRDPLGRPQRNEGPDLGQNVKVPEEIDVERARRILEAIRERLGERFRPQYELEYLERLLDLR
jgi:uncharacterized protein (TIGR02302 family)